MRVLDVIGHELAHMWFGDLVTMRVVERHLAERGLRHLHGDEGHRRPPARMEALAGVRGGGTALGLQDRTNSPVRGPVEFEVRSPAQDAEGMFDGITYGKGSAVLRMMEQHLG